MSDASKGLSLYNTLTRTKEDFVPIDPQQCAHVCLRPDGLRLCPYRQCAAGDRLRRAVPAAAPCLRRRPRHLCAQHHRRRRQDQRAGAARFRREISSGNCRSTRRSARSPKRPPTSTTRMSRRSAAWSRRSSRAPPNSSSRARWQGRHDHAHRTPDRARPCLCRGRRSAVRHRLDAGLRPAVEAQSRRAAGRRPRRRRRAQEEPRRFRALETVVAGRARLGQPVGQGPSGLAHRVLGDVRALSRRGLRHPWRRARPDLPAPRERDRPVALRPRHRCHGQCLDAQRLPAGRGPEDVEERSAISSPSTNCWRPRRSAAANGRARCCGWRC